jgi:hypothetical protein
VGSAATAAHPAPVAWAHLQMPRVEAAVQLHAAVQAGITPTVAVGNLDVAAIVEVRVQTGRRATREQAAPRAAPARPASAWPEVPVAVGHKVPRVRRKLREMEARLELRAEVKGEAEVVHA